MPKRTFFSVGNGLFAMEETDGIRSVYDCGGQNQPLIDKAILRAVNNRHVHIDNLFISHYHKDHVNGLATLLSYCDVDRIILPMIPNLTRVLNYSTIPGNYHYSAFVLNPYSYIQQVSPDTKIIEISTDEEGGQNDNGTRFENIDKDTVIHGKFSMCRQRDWLYVVYNRRSLSDEELDSFLTKLGLDLDSSTDDIIKKLRQKPGNTLLDSLKTVFSGKEMARLNDYSMTVWSGRASDEKDGCFFTGDYNAKLHYKDLKMIYGHYLQSSKIIQIPHHGSEYNFNDSICHKQAIHVVSASNGPYRGRQIVNPDKVINQLTAKGYQELDTRNGDVTI